MSDIESRTGIKLSKNQVEELKNALRNKEYTKLTPKETAKHRNEFNKIKNNFIEEWESNTGQKWPTYTEDVISPNTGKVVRKAGDKYDAHHVVENSFGGEHECGIYIQQSFLMNINQEYMELVLQQMNYLKEAISNEI